jgi:inhibitor of cysteine peptidase
MKSKKDSLDKKNKKFKHISILKNTGLLVLLVAIFAFIIIFKPAGNYAGSNFGFDYSGELKQFDSLDEMQSFIEDSSSSSSYYGGYALTRSSLAVAESDAKVVLADTQNFDGGIDESLLSSYAEPVVAGSSGDIEFSETNNQVKGVDEADIVKTDGDYIYYTNNNLIYIVKANPADELESISEIDLGDNSYPSELFVNGDKLIVIANEYTDRFARDSDEKQDDEKDLDVVSSKIASSYVSSILPYPYYSKNYAVAKIYDISDKEDIELEEDIAIEGNYFDSRMIGDNVYLIINKYMYNDIFPPVIYYMDGVREIPVSSISYFDVPDNSYELSIILSIDLEDNDFDEKTILKGTSQNIFVSKDNIYLVNQNYVPYYYEEKMMIEAFIDSNNVPEDVVYDLKKIMDYDLRESTKISEMEFVLQKYFESLTIEEQEELQSELEPILEDVRQKIQKEREKTIINKFSIDGLDVEFVAQGNVLGNVLNQFSMDEFDGYFRIATTTGNSWDEKNPQENHLYVLNDDLDIVGKLDDLAPNERIYSARFMGDKAYLVTFKNIDPLFVIDLSNPKNPEVLGELKIPGYSDYLHPYDETHLIGIGKDTESFKVEWGDGERVIPSGVKLALFDVSDLSNPKVIDSVVIGDRGTQSDALYDHKAFLFDKNKDIMVLPITVAKIDESKYPEGIESWTYGDYVFMGAYVYGVDLEDGFSLKAKITHLDSDLKSLEYYLEYDKKIQRSLYINDVLYTLSQSKIMANDMSNDFEDIKSIILKEDDEKDRPIYYKGIEPVEIAVDDVTESAIEILE